MQINRNENNQGLKGGKMGEKTNLSVAFDAALHWLTRSDFYRISPWRPRGGSIAPYLKGGPGCWRKKEKRVFMKKPVRSAVNSSRQKRKEKKRSIYTSWLNEKPDFIQSICSDKCKWVRW